jgi:pSer/pThr/pTyr-binding forkhead associated (FHA) protein
MPGKKTWTIGCDPTCDLVLDRPSVSWRHVRLSFEDDGSYILEDLGSTNGTFVNGRRIFRPTQVTRADAVTLGLSVPMPWPPEPAADEPPQTGRTWRIGREPDNDLVLDNPEVSGRHARVLLAPGGREAVVEDLGSTNGTAVGTPGNKVQRAGVSPTDVLFFGPVAVPAARFFPASQDAGPEAIPELVFHGTVMSIGRDSGCDAVVDFPMVSSRHARLLRSGSTLILEDLGSSNGTFVNGVRIEKPTTVNAGDLIGLGSYVVRLTDGSVQVDPDGLATEAMTFGSPESGLERIREPEAVVAGTSSRPLALAAGVALGAQSVLIAEAINLSSGASTENALFGLALGSVWIGLSTGLYEHVLEPGRPADGTTGSKETIAARHLRSLARSSLFGLALCGILLAVVWARFRFAGAFPGAWGALWLASLVGTALGLLLVRLTENLAAGLVAAIGIVVVMGALGGPLRPLPALAPVARMVADVFPARWAFEDLLLITSDNHNQDALNDRAEPFFPAQTLRTGTRACTIALLAMLGGLVYVDVLIVLARAAAQSPRPEST